MATPATHGGGARSEPAVDLRKQAAVATLSVEALSGASLERLMQHAVEVSTSVLGGDAAAICELAPASGRLELQTRHGLELSDGLSCPADATSAFGRCLMTGQPVLVCDWQAERRFDRPAALAAAGIRSSLAVHIPAGDWSGVLSVHAQRPDAFATEGVRSLGELAGVLAAGVRRASLERLLHARSDQHAALAALGRLALSDVPLRQLLAQAAELIGQAMDADLVTVSSRDPDGRLEVQGSHPPGFPSAPSPQNENAASVLVADWAAIGGAPEPLAERSLRCSVTAGVGPHGCHGTLSVHSRRADRFEWADVRMVEACASMLAAAVERSNAERRAAAQRAVSSVLEAATRPSATAPALIEAACLELGWDAGALWLPAGDGCATLFAAWPHPSAVDWGSHPGAPARGRREAGWSDHPNQLSRLDGGPGAGWRAALWAPAGPDGSVLGLVSSRPRPVDGHLLGSFAAIAGRVGELAAGARCRSNQAGSESRRREAAAAMLQADAEEQARIASELHDDTVQEMAAILITLDRVVNAARRGDTDTVLNTAVQARATLATATEHARRLVFELRPQLLDAGGLHAALRGIAARPDLADGVAVVVGGDVERHPQPLEVLVYRTMGELITAARTRPGVTRVAVELDQVAGHLVGLVEDDGPGDHTKQADHPTLAALVERIRLAGGRLDVSRSPAGGTAARLCLPLLC